MVPGNPVVGGTVLRIPAIQSPNFVHDVSGWFIGQDGSAEFDGLTIRGTFNGTDFTINPAGAFFYNGTPANGNLIASIASAAGTDAFGNAYLAGVVSYQFGGLTHTQLNGGQISFDGGAGIEGGPFGELVVGTTGTQFISISFPLLNALVLSQPGTTSTPETWHPITLDAGWTATVTPQYRMLPDGNVQVRGQASHAGTTAATNINSGVPIPFSYWPAANRVYRPPDSCDSAGPVQISTAGVFAMRSTVTNGFTATQVIFDGIYSI